MPEGLTVAKVKRRGQLLKEVDTRFRAAENNLQLQQALDKIGSQAETMILSPRTRDAFDVGAEAESIQSLFADDEIGQGLLLATRLLEFGVPFVSVSHFGWDTHTNNFSGHQKTHSARSITESMQWVTALEEKGTAGKNPGRGDG